MQFKKHAFILAVIDGLRRHATWTGKTHVQKALSLLRDSGQVPVPFRFVLYKHGPYSFEIESELEQMQSYEAVTIEPNAEGYGVVLHPDEKAPFVRTIAPLTEEELQAIESVCAFVGVRGVNELERLATASWIRAQERVNNPAAVARRLHALKPHISPTEAAVADAEVARWLGRKN